MGKAFARPSSSAPAMHSRADQTVRMAGGQRAAASGRLALRSTTKKRLALQSFVIEYSRAVPRRPRTNKALLR